VSGCFSPGAWKTSMISPSSTIAFAQLPDRVPLRQLVGFVISSSLQQRAPPQHRANNASSNANSTGLQALASTSNAS